MTRFWMASLCLVLAITPLLGACDRCSSGAGEGSGGSVSLMNVSYDPTRELYEQLNPLFAAQWERDHHQTVEIEMSHGGSGRQARSVIEGLEADVVTLALGFDVDALHSEGQLLPADWQTRLPNNSSPYTSTQVFLVRQGNPKNIRDWSDLIREDVSVIVPNPKTSGGARWLYLAAWGYALRQPGGSEQTAQAFVAGMYRRVAVLDTGARGSSTSFAQNGLGDVLVTWENEAHLLKAEYPGDNFEIVMPSVSILCEPPVAWVDRNVERHDTAELARAYLDFLYTEEAQEVIASNHYRPRNEAVLARHRAELPEIPMFTLQEVFGDWATVQQRHFADGGVFDQIYTPEEQ